MTTLDKLRVIRDREGKRLKIENVKIMAARKLEKEKQDLIKDIREIRKARMKDRGELRVKASKEIRRLKATGKKVGSKILNYLYALKGE